VQFAGRELSSGLFRSSAARSQCRRFRFQRALSNPNTKRDGESGLHDRLHFGATCVSDELRPTSLHTGTIARRLDRPAEAAIAHEKPQPERDLAGAKLGLGAPYSVRGYSGRTLCRSQIKTPASTGPDRGLDALEEEKNLSASLTESRHLNP